MAWRSLNCKEALRSALLKAPSSGTTFQVSAISWSSGISLSVSSECATTLIRLLGPQIIVTTPAWPPQKGRAARVGGRFWSEGRNCYKLTHYSHASQHTISHKMQIAPISNQIRAQFAPQSPSLLVFLLPHCSPSLSPSLSLPASVIKQFGEGNTAKQSESVEK